MSQWKKETTWRRTLPHGAEGWAAGWLSITRADGDHNYRWEVVLVDVDGIAASGSTHINFTAAKTLALQGYKEACDRLERARGGA